MISRFFEEAFSWFRPVPSKVLPPDTSLLTVEEFIPAGFKVGVEILNDNQTHMDFVVAVLKEELGMEDDDATETMFRIHKTGGVLLPLASLEEAERVAGQVTNRARDRMHPLVCRVAVAQQAAAGDARNARA